MHPQLIAALGAAALATSATAVCSSHHPTPATQDTVRDSGIAVARTNDATVIIDGQQHKVDGQLACTTYDDLNETVISIGTAPKDVLTAVTIGDKPTVKRVEPAEHHRRLQPLRRLSRTRRQHRDSNQERQNLQPHRQSLGSQQLRARLDRAVPGHRHLPLTQPTRAPARFATPRGTTHRVHPAV